MQGRHRLRRCSRNRRIGDGGHPDVCDRSATLSRNLSARRMGGQRPQGRRAARRSPRKGCGIGGLWQHRTGRGGTCAIVRHARPLRHEPCWRLATGVARERFSVLGCPLCERPRGLIGAAELALLQPSAYLINVARAEIVTELPLCEALRDGRIAAAATDVWYRYPPQARSRCTAPGCHSTSWRMCWRRRTCLPERPA